MSWCKTFTDEERKAVEELRRLTIQDCSPKMLENDALFYNFMKARNFNLKNAEDMLQKHISWRKENDIDTILTDFKPLEVVERYSPVSTIGYDKDGDLVKYIDIGRGDPKGVLSSAKKTDVIKYMTLTIERDIEIMKQHSVKTGRTVRKISVICNFDELTFAKVTIKKGVDVLITAAKMYQDNYPEIIKRIFFINGTFYFTILFAVLKPFMAPNLQDKIQVFESDGYQEPLLEVIDANVLPAFLGGNRTDPDGNPNCYAFIKWGEHVPEEFYMPKSEKRLSSTLGVKKLTVSRFSISDIRFEVSEPNSLLEWEFETKSRDIGFGVYFKDSSSEEESKPVELVPKQRIDTCMEPEAGVYKCSKAGTYIVVFDNSYSWIYPKEVFYRSRVIGPNDKNSP